MLNTLATLVSHGDNGSSGYPEYETSPEGQATAKAKESSE